MANAKVEEAEPQVATGTAGSPEATTAVGAAAMAGAATAVVGGTAPAGAATPVGAAAAIGTAAVGTAAAAGAATPVPTRPLRRDAERNRQLILDTAKTVFAQRGLEASLDEVAHAAGLGVGTVYRRFPNRDALIDALFDDMLVSIERIVGESMTLPRAWDGLVHFVTAMLESQGHDKALRDLMLSRQKYLDQCDQDKEEVVRETVEPALRSLIERARDEGDLRPDIEATDVGVLLISAVGVVDFTAPVDAEVWRRHLGVMLDGLRARPGGENRPLAPAALDEDQLEVCMTGWKYGTRETTRRKG